jgi:hypothetical protein
MKKQLLGFLACIGAFALNAQQTPTWSADIACIVYSHCTSCHNPNGIGPFSLNSYDDAYGYRYALQGATTSRYMPPWPPDPSYNSLAHERLLNDDEIALIDAWVNGGAPRGDASEEPEPPQINSPAEIDSPTWTGSIPAYTVPAIANDLYRCFVIPTNFTTDKFITGFEVLPGNREIVHHVLVFQDTTNAALILDANDPGPGYSSFGGVGIQNAKLLGGWVPGASAKFTPDNMGIKLPKNAKIILQIHYPQGSTGQVDSTRLNLLLSNGPMRNLSIEAALNHVFSLTNGPLYIPANTVKTFHAQYTIPVGVTVLGIGPHAHLICESMRSFAVLPNGDTLKLINIPHWDFHWQGFYDFRQPLFLPAGTVLHGYATYNNTTSNPNNPNSPPQAVFLGEATTDEMMLFYFTYTFHFPGDENIVIDDSDHPDHYLDCSTSTVITSNEEAIEVQAIRLYPNPAGDELTVEYDGADQAIFELYDMLGYPVASVKLSDNQQVINTAQLAKGMYYAAIRSDGRLVQVGKVVIQE